MGRHTRGRHRQRTPLHIQIVRGIGVGGVGILCWALYPQERQPATAAVVPETPETVLPLASESLPVPTIIALPPVTPATTTVVVPPPPPPAPTTTRRSTPTQTSTPEPAPKVEPRPEPKVEPTVAPVAVEAVVGSVAAAAQSFLPLNIPYLWGGKSNRGMDCSGFIWRVLQKAGYDVPYRTSYALADWVKPIPRSQARPGDLVFWPGHAAIYAGNGRIYDSGTSRGVVERAMWGSPTFGRIP